MTTKERKIFILIAGLVVIIGTLFNTLSLISTSQQTTINIYNNSTDNTAEEIVSSNNQNGQKDHKASEEWITFLIKEITIGVIALIVALLKTLLLKLFTKWSKQNQQDTSNDGKAQESLTALSNKKKNRFRITFSSIVVI